ncbi:MAG: FG-GAP-like repeat-containing protein [Terriglobales bacterium]
MRRLALAFALLIAPFIWGAFLFQNQTKASDKRQLMRANNLGVAYLNQQKLEEGLKQFEQAVAIDKNSATAQLNLGIALLNLSRVAPSDEALRRAAQLEPKNPAVWYNLGLLHRNNGQAEQALTEFEKAATLAPNDANTHYFLGDLYAQQQKYADAEKEFRRTVEIDPFSVSAEFGLARALQRQGKTAEAKQHFERFQKLTREKLGSPISQIYGEQGPLSLAKVIPGEPAVLAAIPVRFVPATEDSGLPVSGTSAVAPPPPQDATAQGPGICVFDLNGDGLPDVLLARSNRNEGHVSFSVNLGKGRFQDATKGSGLQDVTGAISCGVGDYDNDGKPDIAFTTIHGVLLFHNDGNGKFTDQTKEAHVQTEGNLLSVTFVDYDHDGDLDLYVTHSTGSNVLFRNNGDNTFTDVTEQTALQGSGAGVMLASDVNNDRAIDLVLTSEHAAPSVQINEREGAFKSERPWPKQIPEKTVGVAALDFNKDGWMDFAFTHADAPGVTLWKNADGKHFEEVPLPQVRWKQCWGIAAIDFDNDGWIDLAVVGETANGGEIRLFRNLGPNGFKDVTSEVGLDRIKLQQPRALVAADVNGDGASDLFITQQSGALVVLRNEGGNKNHSLRLSLKGLNDNKSAFGTKVMVFAGESQQRWEVAGSSGYLSQGPDEIIAGLGQEPRADVVRLLWPTGVYQDEIDLAANEPHELLEIDRRGSSCPVLFAWNGSHYELISDVIGAAVFGHWIAPHERDLPDPDEYIKVDGSRLQPRDGLLSLTFAEPMEEVNYLDQARLLAVDHPADVEIYPNERFVANPPFPEFKIITVRNAHLPAGAWDHLGNDGLPALREHDHHYVTGFKLLHFAGFAEPHSLVLDLGEWDASRPLHLLLDGFTEYFTANSMYAASQANLTVQTPYLEAQQPDGSWKRVIEDMGFPAGLPRTITVDLTGKLKPGTRKVRIVTNLQIYWDKALVDNSFPERDVQIREAPLAAARLHFHGYPRVDESRFPGDLNYDYQNVSLTGPYARHVGNYTNYGDVLPLLKAADDKFVIFGSGEEVILDFDAMLLPPLPAGWRRDYLFYANGFVKDMDFYAADAFTVAPLPFHRMGTYPRPPHSKYPLDAASLNYLLEYNSRYQSGNGVSDYKYDYPK